MGAKRAERAPMMILTSCLRIFLHWSKRCPTDILLWSTAMLSSKAARNRSMSWGVSAISGTSMRAFFC